MAATDSFHHKLNSRSTITIDWVTVALSLAPTLLGNRHQNICQSRLWLAAPRSRRPTPPQPPRSRRDSPAMPRLQFAGTRGMWTPPSTWPCVEGVRCPTRHHTVLVGTKTVITFRLFFRSHSFKIKYKKNYNNISYKILLVKTIILDITGE